MATDTRARCDDAAANLASIERGVSSGFDALRVAARARAEDDGAEDFAREVSRAL